MQQKEKNNKKKNPKFWLVKNVYPAVSNDRHQGNTEERGVLLKEVKIKLLHT
jgi:galactose-1-phosphate uridylyltransferase